MASGMFVHTLCLFVVIMSVVVSLGNQSGLFPGTVDAPTTTYDTSGATVTNLLNTAENNPGGALLGLTYTTWTAFTTVVTALYNAVIIGPFLVSVFHVPAYLAAGIQVIVGVAFAFEFYVLLRGINML